LAQSEGGGWFSDEPTPVTQSPPKSAISAGRGSAFLEHPTSLYDIYLYDSCLVRVCCFSAFLFFHFLCPTKILISPLRDSFFYGPSRLIYGHLELARNVQQEVKGLVVGFPLGIQFSIWPKSWHCL